MNKKPSKKEIINQAIKFHLQGNIPEATKYYDYCLKQGWNDYTVFANYAAILYGLGKLNEAEKWLNKAIELNPKSADAHSDLGNILTKLGKLQDAELFTRKAIKLNPEYALPYSNLGSILKDLGKLEDAEVFTRKAIELNPNFANAYSNLGLILRDLGKLEEAELFTRKAIELNPNFANAHLNLGLILRDLGKLQEAELSARKAIELNPTLVIAHTNLGVILKDLGKLQEAELSARKAIELNPKSADAYSNLGNILTNLGKLREAELSARKAIEIKPDYVNAYSNLGLILRDLGKLQEAEVFTRKATELNPNFANAYSNLGLILRDLGKLQEAEVFTCKAIELNPNFANAYSNLGLILRDLGKLEEAELYTRKAIELNPNFADAYSNLGSILEDLGKLQEAFDSYLKIIDINPKNSNVYSSITILLRDADPSRFEREKLQKILNILLEKNDIRHQELFYAFNFLYSKKIINILKKFDSEFSQIENITNHKIIINALKKMIFCNIQLEGILTKVRKNICNLIANEKENFNQSGLEFIISLGEQCFLNEYVYINTPKEKEYIEAIIDRCIYKELNEINIAILSCYYPLYKLLDRIPKLKSFTSSNPIFKEIIDLQIKEPLRELELSKKIKRLGKMNNDISLRVKSQYEENPYPRWRYAYNSESYKSSIIQAINNSINPNYISAKVSDEKLKVLIAGCGTGSQILNVQRYKNAQITAIDLSLTSLSYAQRKINELGIKNVDLIQMDILEVALLREKFDIIECVGVLHHMDNPTKGLEALLDILKKNGFLKLGLYSELARRDIIKARKYISSKKVQANENSIRNFRQKISSGVLNDLKSFQLYGDFFSLSEFRDLCFHVKEHRFTINQIQDTIQSNELKFLGFQLRKSTKLIYEEFFPEDTKQINLKNWIEFEEKYPNTFIKMYQFWVSKN